METRICSIEGSVNAIFAADASQNLLIVRAPVTGTDIHLSLYILSIRDTTGHPCCSLPNHTLNVRAPEEWVEDRPHYTRCHIFGDTLSLTFANGDRAVHLLMRWTDGQLKCVAPFWSVGDIVYSGFALLSPDIFLVARSRRFDCIGSICVNVLHPLQPSVGSTTAQASHHAILAAQYELPATQGSALRLVFAPFESSKFDYCGYASHAPLLQHNPEASMMHVSLSIAPFSLGVTGPVTRRDEFYTPIWPFLRSANNAKLDSSDHEPEVIPWAEWGPTKTRWIDQRWSTIDDGEVVEGVAVDTPDWAPLSRLTGNREGARIVFTRHIVDFAPMELARVLHSRKIGKMSMEDGIQPMVARRERIVTEPTVIRAVEYAEPVVSYLAYRETQNNPPLECDDIMLIGEKVVALSVRASVRIAAVPQIEIFHQAEYTQFQVLELAS